MTTHTVKLAAALGLALLMLSAAAGFAYDHGAPRLHRARPNPWLAIGAAIVHGLLHNDHGGPGMHGPDNGYNPGYNPGQQQQQSWGDYGQNQQQDWGGYGKQGQKQQQGWDGYGQYGQNQQQGWQTDYGKYGKHGQQQQQQQGGWYW